MLKKAAAISLLLIATGASAWAQQDKNANQAPAGKREQAGSTAEGAAVSSSRLALPFKRSWQYLTDSAAMFPPALDALRVYLPLAAGRVVCLDLDTGSLLWSTEAGGVISAPIAVGEKAVFIVTRKTTDDGSDAGANLRAVDKETGLTLWAKDYARAFTSTLTLARGRIYAGSADGSLYALDAAGGEVVWRAETQDVVRGRALVTESVVYFGSDDGALRGVETERGREVFKFQTGGRVEGRPAVDDRDLYFGSADGYVYALDLRSHKLRWRSRTGAAIEASPVLAGEIVLVASFDNFVYALSRASGDRVWKRRLDNRIVADPIVEGDATLIAPHRGDYVAVFLNSDGRPINYYQLERGTEIIARPVFSGDRLVLATDKGLVVATAQQQGNRTNAAKK
ncbi:MAG TPA: PQQ-binding-like beta-propeller repeat protein [Blastocatellia bacterium]|nr:PQQ-binding-like beta-propeller repeat protein [Blastocatellia bacterium]